MNETPCPFERLANALAAVGDPPCMGCPHRTFCAEDSAACVDFAKWANSPPYVKWVPVSRRAPSATIFNIMERGVPKGLDDGAMNGLWAILHAEAVALEDPAGLYTFVHKGRDANYRGYKKWLVDRGVKPLNDSAIFAAMRLRGIDVKTPRKAA